MAQPPNLAPLVLLPFVFMLFMFAFMALVLAFWIWMIVDCATKEPPGNEKIVWILIVVVLGLIGAIVYFFVRRSPRRRGVIPVTVLPPPRVPSPIRVDPNDIRFSCGVCGQSLIVDASGAGMSVDCPKCGKPVNVPSRR
jgi:hypothetical protein